MRSHIRSLVTILVLGVVAVGLSNTAHAVDWGKFGTQPMTTDKYGGQDWTNASACEVYRTQYEVFVSMHNASSNRQVRESYRRQIEDIGRQKRAAGC